MARGAGITGLALLGLVASASLASLGCAGPKVVKPPASVPETGERDAVEPPKVPLDTVAPPTEIDLILEEARMAEGRGDLASALGIYEDAAASGGLGAEERADVRYHLALLYLDPVFEWRRIEESRSILQDLVQASPPFSRRMEARLVLGLIEELEHMQAATAALEGREESLRTEVDGLRTRLKEKEEELERIKQVLLQKEP